MASSNRTGNLLYEVHEMLEGAGKFRRRNFVLIQFEREVGVDLLGIDSHSSAYDPVWVMA